MKSTKDIPEGRRLLTEKEAAVFLAERPASLANQRARGVGPLYIKLGPGRNAPVRYDLADLEKYIQAGKRYPRFSGNDT